jgi:hypothetical protein
MKINQRKKEALQANIWRSALVSVAAIQYKFQVREIRMYHQAFGLNNESLQNIADEHVCQWRS